MFIITSEDVFTAFGKETAYLAWQEPPWDEDGYFWTRKETIQEMIEGGEHKKGRPFLFSSILEANELLKSFGEGFEDCFIEEWEF